MEGHSLNEVQRRLEAVRSLSYCWFVAIKLRTRRNGGPREGGALPNFQTLKDRTACKRIGKSGSLSRCVAHLQRLALAKGLQFANFSLGAHLCAFACAMSEGTERLQYRFIYACSSSTVRGSVLLAIWS